MDVTLWPEQPLYFLVWAEPIPGYLIRGYVGNWANIPSVCLHPRCKLDVVVIFTWIVDIGPAFHLKHVVLGKDQHVGYVLELWLRRQSDFTGNDTQRPLVIIFGVKTAL